MKTSGVSGAKRRIPELDGLRGTAILIVVIFHYVIESPTNAGPISSYLQQFVVPWGGAGVDLFFVLSGFLIGGILLDAQASPSYFKTFYARRFFRIIPLYYGWTVLYILLVALAAREVEVHLNFGTKIALDSAVYAHFLFLQNLRFLRLPALAGLSWEWFGPTWSLAVEEQFYLISPLVVRVLSTRSLYRFLSAIVVVGPLLRFALLKAAYVGPATIFTSMPCRADTFAVGMLAATVWREVRFRDWLSTRQSWLYGLFGVLLAGILGFWRWSPDYQSLPMQVAGYTWVALFFAVALLLALQDSSGPIASVMRMKWLCELGTVSYCVYVIHLVVNLVCHRVLLHSAPAISTPKSVAVTILAGVLTFALAKVSWICFEGPLLRVGHKFKYAEDTRKDRVRVAV